MVSRSIAPAASTNSAVGVKAAAPRDMKLLIVAMDGTEPDYAAIKFFVETLGIPYQTAFTLRPGATVGAAPVPQPLPALTDPTGSKGLFQGIILTDGNLGYCYTPAGATQVCQSSVSQAGWDTLEGYARDFGVRLVAYYAFPEARYGLAYDHAVATTDAAPAMATFTPAAAPLFPYLNPANPVKIANAYLYYAKPAPAAGETTTPILSVGGLVAGAVHTKADGREYMVFTMDNNPYLLHSLTLNYGIINWVTKGVFLGGRKVYLTPQVDDVFLSNDEYVQGVASCTPVGFVTDPTFDPANACPTLRITGSDLKGLADWQKSWNANSQFQRFKVTHAFNGVGATDGLGALLTKDDLVNQSVNLRGSFFWINHTWDHEDLDCYNPAPNAGVRTCIAANYAQAGAEIAENAVLAKLLTLPLDKTSMVTPGITGLKNAAFLKAASDLGIRYLVSDTSHPEYVPAIPNTGIRNTFQNSLLMIPRRPTNLFYNTVTGQPGVPGSLTDEYNYFYGPQGIFRIGGAGGPAFFPTTQTYADIINRESDNLLTYMLRYEIYPQMYHQSNLYRYNGRNSMFSDVHDAALNKFARISTLPVTSLTQTDLGREIESKMAVLSAQVTGTLTPGRNIVLSGRSAATVTLTGVCFGTNCESYGGQCVSKVAVAPVAIATIPAASLTAPCAVNTGLPDPGGPIAPIPPVPPVTPAPVVPPPPVTPTSSSPYALNRTIGDQILNLETAANVTPSDIASLDEAASDMNDSLDPSLWLDKDRLLTTEGSSVFEAHGLAAVQLLKVMNDKKSQVPDAAIQTILKSLVSIDQSIVAAAIKAAQTAGVPSKDVDNANKELQAADQAAAQLKYDAAIQHYGNAWGIAMDAIDNAKNN